MSSAIHLLRCKAEPLAQADAFSSDRTAAEVIVDSFLARPTSRVRRGSVWHIGNSKNIDGVIYFALGREAVLNAPEFDENLREFREVEKRQAPFTVGVFDPRDQTIGVLIRQGVSLNAHEVAGKLQTLLEEAGVARKANRKIRVDYVSDPTGFIEAIESAHRVTRFEFSFTVPNPPKDEKYVQRPLKEFAKRAGANEGKASIKGDDMERDELVDVASAVAAAGDDASANVQMKPGQKIQRKRLRMNAMREAISRGDTDSIVKAVTMTMRKAFDRVSDRYADRSDDG